MSISPGDQIINFYNLIGKSPQMKKLYEDIKRVVHSSTVTVLILGESGTGKELIA
ncbi:MAG: sigma 54-interacting transcriptional regulator, partial [Calditrichaeota bacterium]|nr:sigma 54-interacting transcriptional regulator [Calditrichota bacterium]